MLSSLNSANQPPSMAAPSARTELPEFTSSIGPPWAGSNTMSRPATVDYLVGTAETSSGWHALVVLICSRRATHFRNRITHRTLLAPWQAELVADNDRYWPKGFVNELIALFMKDSDEESRTAKLTEMHRRAAEELTADGIAHPRRAHGESAAQQAAFEARLEARWGRGLDLTELVVHEAFESGRWVNDLLRPAMAANQDQKFEALIRLHGKAVMTAREVLVLLRCGYSSGRVRSMENPARSLGHLPCAG